MSIPLDALTDHRIVVDYVAAPALAWRIAPRMLRTKARWQALEASPAAKRLARWAGRFGLTLEFPEFRAHDLHDERGVFLRLRLAHDDLAAIHQAILEAPAIRAIIDAAPDAPRLRSYLAKGIGTIGFGDRGTLWRAMMAVQVCVWLRRRDGGRGSIQLLMERQPWFEALVRYARRADVELIGMPPQLPTRARIRQRIPLGLRQAARRLPVRSDAASHASPLLRSPRIAVDYYGQLNLDDPGRYSDLTFWQRSQIPGRDVVVLFAHPEDPIDAAKWQQLSSRGLEGIALTRGARGIEQAPLCTPPAPVPARRRLPDAPADPLLRGWLREQVDAYDLARRDWRDLFARQQIRVFVSWFKYHGLHCAIADALRDVGGLLALYQRAYEFHPSPETAVDADLMFGFCRLGAEIEGRSGSVVPHYIVTGYLGDHRFPILREQATVIRARLAAHGAARVIAFADENSKDDARWYGGHELLRESYAFLLERVLRDPRLGVVLKPKVPSTLRRRLGPVAPLLAEALATGRCHLFDAGALHGAYPPAAAALAADVMIHGHACAATAGVEAALAGVPTLLLDREGWPIELFERPGPETIVFRSWDRLWKACEEHRTRPGGRPGLGDWSGILGEFDPFRDGHASRRMGEYLAWVLEGLRAKLPPATVLADASERYASEWGREHVLSLARGSVADFAKDRATAADGSSSSAVRGLQPVQS